MQQIVKMTSPHYQSLLFSSHIPNHLPPNMQQIVKMTSPINLFESLCMPDHSLLNMHAADSKDDITFDLFDSLCMPGQLLPNLHAADIKDDIS